MVLKPRSRASLADEATRSEAALREPFTAEQVSRLLDAAGPERPYALVLCGLLLGLRPGELAGLLWADLDLDAATLTVSGSMKRGADGKPYRGNVKRSTAGVRRLRLTPKLVTALREHRRAQAAEPLALGEVWTDHGLIFCSEMGSPLDPSNVRRTFARVARRADLDGFPYLLRHTVVSLLLDGGASIDEVADLTGDDPATLYHHYRHKVRPVATLAADRMPAILGES